MGEIQGKTSFISTQEHILWHSDNTFVSTVNETYVKEI